ncbi:MAG: hypothetical protein WBF93_14425, partial [Pirellulales bacterium]
MSDKLQSRRKFINLGLAASGAGVLAGFGMAGCRDNAKTPDASSEANSNVDESGVTSGDSGRERVPQGIDLEKWNRIKGEPYESGGFANMPGVCRLPGPLAKRNWPDRNKYKDVKKVPGMCQLCSTVCGIVGYVKDDRVIKIEGNPNDPNSRGHLCARGQAGLNHLYHPERLLYPLKRV